MTITYFRILRCGFFAVCPREDNPINDRRLSVRDLVTGGVEILPASGDISLTLSATMDPAEKTLEPTEDTTASRAIAFPDENVVEEKPKGALRPKGVEMKRNLTKDDKELAAAGYEHLEEQKVSKDKQADLSQVDIQEHMLNMADLEKELDTSFDQKQPSASVGLLPADAKTRLERDGPNVLTPPKKKSALRKVAFILNRK